MKLHCKQGYGRAIRQLFRTRPCLEDFVVVASRVLFAEIGDFLVFEFLTSYAALWTSIYIAWTLFCKYPFGDYHKHSETHNENERDHCLCEY